MKLIGNFGLPTWLMAIIACIVGVFIIARLRILENLSYFFRGMGVTAGEMPRTFQVFHQITPVIEDVGGVAVHTGNTFMMYMERMPPLQRAFSWVMHLLEPVYMLAAEFFHFLAAPLNLTKQQITDEAGWRVLFTLGAILSVVGAVLGFYRSNFPRKYEFASRDYNLEKRLFGQRQA
jgi:hypothetical protein